jgi:hypothetical protein
VCYKVKELRTSKLRKLRGSVRYSNATTYFKVGSCDKSIYLVLEDSSVICTIFSTKFVKTLAIGHGGRRRMLRKQQRKYKNVTVVCID